MRLVGGVRLGVSLAYACWYGSGMREEGARWQVVGTRLSVVRSAGRGYGVAHVDDVSRQAA